MAASNGVVGARGRDLYPARAARWTLVAGMSLAALLLYGDRFIIDLVVKHLQRDLGLNEWSVSLLMGSPFALLYALFGLPLGRLADRSNRRNLVIGGMVLWSSATMASAASATFSQLFVARFFVGVGQAVLMPAATSMIADSFPPRDRAHAVSAFHIGAILGAGLSLGFEGLLLGCLEHGLLANVPLLSKLPPWRNAMLLAGLSGLPLCFFLLRIREPARQGVRVARRMTTLAHTILANQGRVARACLAVGVVAAGDYGLLSWLPTHLDRAYGIHPDKGGQIIGVVVAVGGLFGCLVSGWSADYAARRRGLVARIWVMRVGYGACALSIPFFMADSSGALLAGATAWVFGSVFAFVAANVYLTEAVANEHRATTIALCNACSAIVGLGLGPPLVIALSHVASTGDHRDLVVGISSLCAISVIAAFALLAWRIEPEKAHDE